MWVPKHLNRKLFTFALVALRRVRRIHSAHRLALNLVVVAVTFVTFCAAAQAATIEGRVVDINGRPLANIMVTAVNVQTQFGAVATTDNAGDFSLEELPLGYYWMHGYRDFPSISSSFPMVWLDREAISPLRIVFNPGLAHGPAAGCCGTGGAGGYSGTGGAGGGGGGAGGFGGVGGDGGGVPKNYARVSVLYGTDRKPISAGESQVVFGAERGELVVGMCEVSIPRDHRLGELESPQIWKLEFRPDPSKHVALLSTARMDMQEFRAVLQQRMVESGVRDSLVFIHGYNVSFEDAARRTAQIAYDLGFRGVPSFYSWPSNGKMLDYVADSEQARRAVRYLTTYLEMIFADESIDQVHLIAHSMGNQVLTAALQQLAAKMPTAGRPRIGQIALIAPDIDAEVFRTEIAPQIVGVGRRLTLYASNHDKALEMSRRLHNYPRAGDLKDIVTIIKGMDTIDASAVDTSFLGHSYFAENRSVIADLFALVRKDAAPSERFGMRPADGLPYWVFAP